MKSCREDLEDDALNNLGTSAGDMYESKSGWPLKMTSRVGNYL